MWRVVAVLTWHLTWPALAAAPIVRTTPIPGGTVTYTSTTDTRISSEQRVLLVAGHTLLARGSIALGYHPEIASEPWTVSADGRRLFSFGLTMPLFADVVRGDGRSYVLLTGSQGPDTTDIVWIADVSGAIVTVTPAIHDCVAPKGRVVAGSFVLDCARTSRTPHPVHRYKDNVLH